MARIVFMGTPGYAQQILAKICDRGDTFLVVTKPDTPQGRGRRLSSSDVARWAQAQGLDLVKPCKLKDLRSQLDAFRPDYILTAAYGRILPKWLLDLPRFGSYNLHASLLPRWRGPNPIAWAILAQDEQTGVTLMRMDEGVDTGPIVSQGRCAIAADDTTASLADRLAELAAGLWTGALSRWGLTAFPAQPQSTQGVTFAPKFDADANRVDWTRNAHFLDAHIRSMTPDPGAYTTWHETRLKIWRAQVHSMTEKWSPGTAVLDGNDWLVGTGMGILRICAIQPAGGRPMSPGAYVRGRSGRHPWVLS
ncbi:MAG: methionyl-tRNA formyltransferase [Sulfobacillus acidophilus]|uniref:Methionyl-tRNA formyltransferase n=1 Tax=Sulfobacillus acidophilus TaxID=53633 RepID=A0A2T2WEX0_9FIRM|nr:MAG: methionyl-tRNA formyltransferase [Sulfobacillus acidophilus]